MTMRLIKIATRLSTDEAHTLIEFLDEVRDALMASYGQEIRSMLQQATTQEGPAEHDTPF